MQGLLRRSVWYFYWKDDLDLLFHAGLLVVERRWLLS